MKSIITLSLAVCIAMGTPAAAEPVQTGTLKISVADIDMSTPAGRRKAELRIARAASAFCESDSVNPRFSLAVQRSISECERSVTTAAFAALAGRRGTQIAAN